MGVVKVAVRIGDWTDNKNMMLKKIIIIFDDVVNNNT